MKERKIITTVNNSQTDNENPWRAYRGEEYISGSIGKGATELEAIKNLRSKERMTKVEIIEKSIITENGFSGKLWRACRGTEWIKGDPRGLGKTEGEAVLDLLRKEENHKREQPLSIIFPLKLKPDDIQRFTDTLETMKGQSYEITSVDFNAPKGFGQINLKKCTQD